jgi:hypothetical protein
LIGGLPLSKTWNWTPAFAGVTDKKGHCSLLSLRRKRALFFVVIPAEAGIQDNEEKKFLSR